MGIDLICLFLLTLFGVEGHIVGENDSTDTTNTIYPFTVPYDEEMVADLYRRLNSTRWPQELQSVTGDHGDWDYGIPRHLVQEYADYLFHNYSWKLQVKKLNEMSQYQTTIDDYNIHFIHQKSSYPNAVPLLFLHGWPGSFWECSKILPMLTEPHKYGGKRENSFHVICPSIPGYGYSSSPKKKGFDQYECALLFTKLMDRLGYPKYYLQGGDWGSTIASLQASLPENSNKILGLHLNMVPVALPYAKGIFPLLSSLLSLVLPWFYFTTTERKLLNELPLKILQETGYFHEQSTRPLTLSYSLSDSPVGLLAWIGEKFYVWSDCTRKDFQIIHPPDEFLTNFMIYWSTNTVGSSMRFYSEMFNYHQKKKINVFERLAQLHVEIPTAAAIFPQEIIPAIRYWAGFYYTNIIQWTIMPSGGHFAALEEPELLVNDLWKFKETVKRKYQKKSDL